MFAAVATFIVNLVIGNLAEDNLRKVAEENTIREALHVEAMIRGPMSTSSTQPSEPNASDGAMQDGQQSGQLSLDSAEFYEGLLRTIPTIAQGLNVVKEPVPKAMLRPAWVNDAHHTG